MRFLQFLWVTTGALQLNVQAICFWSQSWTRRSGYGIGTYACPYGLFWHVCQCHLFQLPIKLLIFFDKRGSLRSLKNLISNLFFQNSSKVLKSSFILCFKTSHFSKISNPKLQNLNFSNSTKMCIFCFKIPKSDPWKMWISWIIGLNFVKCEIFVMWIMWKMRFLKCGILSKMRTWRFEFLDKMWIFAPVSR